ncbi:MAG TPA: cell wall biosynthesis protein [Methanothermobacter sp.]|nr:putative cell wall biosynthesis protein [Methanothermobacter sp. MT-2]HHW05712.1 cell wall biosynthesis protein [Methanothermobacter sp.]HOK72973.1 cell wall biosynthesis protein [Methanothermobacter sp.]HOL69279.1 cell wall biosynthesis protein [Methanothermobacter sp.]HPQ04497.1 cell wall biosynthesis protein [Methanothermobacter sp.]
MLTKIIIATILTLILTQTIKHLIEKYARSTNLYTKIRDGTPRGVGIAPFIVLILFLPSPYNLLVGIMGLLAFIDDIIGRKKIKTLNVEWGQLARGFGIILVSIMGYPFMGPSSILVAFMIQPLNIADMQPGAACTTIIITSLLVILLNLVKSQPVYVPLLILATCIAYSPLDYKGEMMMGEIGNHSYAIALGVSFHFIGGFITVLIFLLLTTFIIALVRRKNLTEYIQENLGIQNPSLGDCFMDVLTGGGLGDLLRRIILKEKRFEIENRTLKSLGLRRLLHNPNT